MIGDSDFYERFLDIHEVREMSDMTVAGKHISKLSSMRVEAAVNSDRLFGKILAYALGIILKQAKKAGIPEGIPICLGGKPSYALPYFGPSAQRIMGGHGHHELLTPFDHRRARQATPTWLARRSWPGKQQPAPARSKR